jgi:hypothetical protein
MKSFDTILLHHNLKWPSTFHCLSLNFALKFLSSFLHHGAICAFPEKALTTFPLLNGRNRPYSTIAHAHHSQKPAPEQGKHSGWRIRIDKRSSENAKDLNLNRTAVSPWTSIATSHPPHDASFKKLPNIEGALFSIMPLYPAVAEMLSRHITIYLPSYRGPQHLALPLTSHGAAARAASTGMPFCFPLLR